jgi:hypothetical protein
VKHHRSRTSTLVLFGLLACESTEQSAASTFETSEARASEDSEQVLLEGAFQAVSKTARGKVRVIRVGERYELRLEAVELAAEGAHVYLVGLEEASTSNAVDAAELKYDLGPLQTPAQTIELPSAPDPSLRVVVLWNPRYAVNLAAARLRAP